MGFNATFSEDPAQFDTLANLQTYDALLFLHNSEDVLYTPERKDNLRSYLIDGGNLAGIHSGSAILYQEAFYSAAIGAWFDRCAQAVCALSYRTDRGCADIRNRRMRRSQ